MKNLQEESVTSENAFLSCDKADWVPDNSENFQLPGCENTMAYLLGLTHATADMSREEYD